MRSWGGIKSQTLNPHSLAGTVRKGAEGKEVTNPPADMKEGRYSNVLARDEKGKGKDVNNSSREPRIVRRKKLKHRG